MFHVEHFRMITEMGDLRTSDGSSCQPLVVKADQQDDSEDYGGEKDLRNMVVKNLLIRLRGVPKFGFFLD
jgi:hypothetical protein